MPKFQDCIKGLDIRVIAISAILAVLLSFAVVRIAIKPQPQIAIVDLKGILQEFILGTAASKLEGEALNAYVKEYTGRLDRLTRELAKQENFIIVPKNAVLAGGIDITKQVKALIEQGYGNEEAN